MKAVLLGTIVSGVLLFLWGGLAQILPWGVPTANVLISQSAQQAEPFLAPNVKQAPANQWTTPAFDNEMVNKINTLTTDNTFSWIVTKPLSYYNPTNYFLREMVTQLLVGLLLTLLALLTRPLPQPTRLWAFGLAGIAAVSGSYGSLFNWWGLTTIYALGVSINLIVSWLIAGFILIRFIVKPVVQ